MFEDRPIEDAVMKDQSAEDRAAKAAADKAKLQERLERMNRDGYVVDAGFHCDHCVQAARPCIVNFRSNHGKESMKCLLCLQNNKVCTNAKLFSALAVGYATSLQRGSVKATDKTYDLVMIAVSGGCDVTQLPDDETVLPSVPTAANGSKNSGNKRKRPLEDTPEAGSDSSDESEAELLEQIIRYSAKLHDASCKLDEKRKKQMRKKQKASRLNKSPALIESARKRRA